MLDDPGSAPYIHTGETRIADRTSMYIDCAYSLCQNWPDGKSQGQAISQVSALQTSMDSSLCSHKQP